MLDAKDIEKKKKKCLYESVQKGGRDKVKSMKCFECPSAVEKQTFIFINVLCFVSI